MLDNFSIEVLFLYLREIVIYKTENKTGLLNEELIVSFFEKSTFLLLEGKEYF